MPSVVIGRLRAIDGDMIVIGRQRIRVPTGLQTEGALVAESITRNEDDPLTPQT